jgi:acyl-CoA hydrolase
VLKGKPVSASKVDMVEIALPSDANPLGNVHGGYVMHLLDVAGAIAAMRHCRRPVVTVSVDRLSFLSPIKVGHFIQLKASVNFTGKTSMEVGVKVSSENPITGEERHTSSAYLTFVALDDHGQPTRIPPVIPQTREEKRRYKGGEARRRLRLAERER